LLHHQLHIKMGGGGRETGSSVFTDVRNSHLTHMQQTPGAQINIRSKSEKALTTQVFWVAHHVDW